MKLKDIVQIAVLTVIGFAIGMERKAQLFFFG